MWQYNQSQPWITNLLGKRNSGNLEKDIKHRTGKNAENPRHELEPE